MIFSWSGKGFFCMKTFDPKELHGKVTYKQAVERSDVLTGVALDVLMEMVILASKCPYDKESAFRAFQLVGINYYAGKLELRAGGSLKLLDENGADVFDEVISRASKILQHTAKENGLYKETSFIGRIKERLRR